MYNFFLFFIDSCLNKITAKDAANELNRSNVIGFFFFFWGGGGGGAVGLLQKNGKERLPFFSFCQFSAFFPAVLHVLTTMHC